MTKQDKIQEVYGDHWETVKSHVDSNGWCCNDFQHLIKELDGYYCEERPFDVWRPKSIYGIEHNNGWIKIESQTDLPMLEIDCHFIVGPIIYNGIWDNLLKSFYHGKKAIKNVEYYSPIIFPQLPIY